MKSRFNSASGDHILEVNLEDLRRLVNECDHWSSLVSRADHALFPFNDK